MSVLTLRPNSSDVYQHRTAALLDGTTNNYTVVDEETLSEADFIQTAYTVQTKIDIFGLPNHTSESGTINSVTVKLKAKYIITGTDTTAVTVNPALKIGSTIYYSGTQNLTSSTAEYTYTWSTNPATSSAWGSDWSVIDSLLAGLRSIGHDSDSKNYRNCFCYQLWVEVDYTAGGGASIIPHILTRKPFRHMLIR